jgi:hypothetical protein
MGRRLPLGERTESQQQYESIEPSSDRFESAGAAFRTAKFETVTDSLFRLFDEGDEEDDNVTLISPETLNKEVPDLPIPIADPMTRRDFNLIKKGHEKRMLEQSIASAGPNDYLQVGMNFGASILAHASDPLEIGAGLATGGIFTLAKGVQLGARSGSILRGLRSAQRLRTLESKVPFRALKRDVLEGIVGNAAVEPVVLAASRADNADYDVFDSVQGIALGTIGFAGVKYGIHKGFEFARSLKGKQGEMLDEVSRAQFLNDKKVDVDPMMNHFLSETNARPVKDSMPMGSVRPVKRNIPFVEKTEADLRGTDLFAVNHRGRAEIHKDSMVKYEEDFGDTVVHLTEDPDFANGSANRTSGSSNKGKIIRVTAGEQNLINLETPFSKQVLDVIKKALGKDGEALFKRLKVDASGRNVIDGLKEGIASQMVDELMMDRITKALSDAGFDGYKFTGGKALGGNQPRYNGMALFKTDKLNVVDSFSPDVASRVMPDKNLIRQQLDHSSSERSDIDFDPELEVRTKSLLEGGDPDIQEASLKAFEVEQLEELNIRKDMGQVSKTFVDTIKQEELKAKKLEEIDKAALVCVGRSGS